MAIRMTGMISGLDTDSIIKELVAAQRHKNKKTTDKKTQLEWKQEKWKSLNTRLYSLYTTQLSNMKLQKNYLTKKSSSTDESKVTITAGKDAPEGSHQISVSQLASSQYVTGGKVEIDKFDRTTKLSDIGFTANKDVIRIKHGEKEMQLAITDKTTVDDFLNACSEADLNATYDKNQQRFFISSKSSGEENAFTITTGQYTEAGLTSKNQILGLVNMDVSSTAKEVNKALVALQGTGNTESAEKTLINLANENANADATSKATSYYRKEIANKTSLSDEEISEIEKKYEKETDEEKRTKLIEEAKTKALNKKIDKELQSSEYQDKIKAAVNDGLTLSGEDAKYSFESKAKREEAATNSMKSAISAYKTVYEAGNGMGSLTGSSPLEALGLGEITNVTSDSAASGTSKFTLIAAKNSIIEYNGVQLENSSNTVSVNGLTLDIKGTTDGPVSVGVSRDTEACYNMVKDFVKEYNSILKEMNTLYNAPSSRGYDPLSDEEKKEMTDDEIEKWEKKIQDSILRRDNSLGGIMNSMKSALQTSVEVDGKKYSLASFGIQTSADYTENGLLHIYGDEDDPLYKDSTNKLQDGLTNDPDLVMEVLTGIAKNLSDTMQDKMKKTSLSSALTFYNDKDISNQITSLTKQIKKDEDSLKDMEDRYYDQFGKMETALANLQSQQNALAGLLGGGGQ